MRDIVYYGLINGAVIASAIFQHRSIQRLRVDSALRLYISSRSLPSIVDSVHEEFRPLRANLRSFRNEMMEKLDTIHRELREHIATCQRNRLTNRDRPKN